MSRTTPIGSENSTSGTIASWPTMSKNAVVWPVGIDKVIEFCGGFVSVHFEAVGSAGSHGATFIRAGSLDVIVTGTPPIGAALEILTLCCRRTPVNAVRAVSALSTRAIGEMTVAV